MRKTKTQKGITLIALLVTVAVLTILVAVAISGVKNDGIIAETKNSAGDFEIAQEKENLQRVVLGWSLDETDTLENYFKTKFGEEKVQANVDASITVEVESGNRYVVTEDGEVTLLDGTVEEPTPILPEVILDKTSIITEILSESTATETITATLKNATGTLTWTSSNTSVAEISGEGNTRTITLKAKGTATITVSYGSYSATCTVNVTEIESVTITFKPDNVGFGLFSLYREGDLVYAEKLEAYEMKVAKGAKIEPLKHMWGGGPSAVVGMFPMGMSEFEENIKYGYNEPVVSTSDLPCIGFVCAGVIMWEINGTDYYNFPELYATEDMTINCISD